tara:strand:- start:1131 stop:1640 length:510 start_codon:yes stop_codon:yes gene_type:complete
MQEEKFIERQYLGLNKVSISRRMTLAIFCFIGYYLSENPERLKGIKDISSTSGDLFFLMGIIILSLSIILIFILHFETKVVNRSIILDGLWTSRKVKINIDSLVSVNKIKYSRFFFNKSVYNLHYKGKIRFFTRGNDAVELIDKDDQVYIIGSQRSDELSRVISNELKN